MEIGKNRVKILRFLRTLCALLQFVLQCTFVHVVYAEIRTWTQLNTLIDEFVRLSVLMTIIGAGIEAYTTPVVLINAHAIFWRDIISLS